VNASAAALNKEVAPRERILAAACELFRARGILAVSVEDIAAAAQSNKMTLYRHFRSKDDLIAEYLRSVAKHSNAVADKALRAGAADAYARLRAAVARAGEDWRILGGRGCPISNAAVELSSKDHPGRAVIEEFKIGQRERLIEVCREAGFLEPEHLADQILLLFEGACVDIQTQGAHGPGARYSKIALALIDSHPRRPELS
jgi:AcrR family transcriptional regulator